MDGRAAGLDRRAAATLAEAARGGALHRLDGVLALLEEGLEEPVRTVHGCRRNLKRVRAGLRLLRDAGQEGLREAERACRDVARALSPMRDADVSLGRLARLRKTLDDLAALTELEALAGAIRAGRSGRSLDRPLASGLAGRLSAARDALAGADVGAVADGALLGALGRSHARGRRAWKRAVASDAAEDWHELRKAAKRELYQLALLEHALGPGRRGRMEPLDALSQALGEHQDLWVLHGRLTGAGLAGEGPLGSLLSDRLDAARRRSRREAARVYG